MLHDGWVFSEYYFADKIFRENTGWPSKARNTSFLSLIVQKLTKLCSCARCGSRASLLGLRVQHCVRFNEVTVESCEGCRRSYLAQAKRCPGFAFCFVVALTSRVQPGTEKKEKTRANSFPPRSKYDWHSISPFYVVFAASSKSGE